MIKGVLFICKNYLKYFFFFGEMTSFFDTIKCSNNQNKINKTLSGDVAFNPKIHKQQYQKKQ